MHRLRLLALVVGSIVGLSLDSAASGESGALKVMSFNTMCDLCATKSESGRFADRLDAMADTINRHDPDLIGLQEVRTRRQIRRIRNRLKEKYLALFARGFPLSYADPVLLLRKSRFELRDSGGFWLGPRAPNFSLGWGIGIPRRVEYALVVDRRTGRMFYFVSAHFDNNAKNRIPSADLFAEVWRGSRFPVVFAGDTNLRPTSPGYATLLGEFRDSFREVSQWRYFSNGMTTPSDGCNLTKTAVFPECRVDHVLLSQDAPWRIRNWGVDVYQYPKTRGFVSDHRAVVVELVE